MILLQRLLTLLWLSTLYCGLNGDEVEFLGRKLSSSITVSSETQFINALSTGFTAIHIDNDIYLNSTIRINNFPSLEINGNGFKIDGQGMVACFDVLASNLSLKNLSIFHGVNIWNAGGVSVQNSNVSLSDIVFHANDGVSSSLFAVIMSPNSLGVRFIVFWRRGFC